ncbi:zinc ribbon domain-containing protein [uncultured Selenomonas sp.]|uniref:zinc ribbon domain-containing protein n=1 Tax=uncultured Selenomonas sp. TaxID=159275 RepID=UPI0028DB8E5F|nr:zinc ribbon domain-containing protein [uncultured Selenomonas sp.]
MFCPKCSKFVPSSASACPNCGIPIITGFSPNYGAGFDLGDDDSESRNDAPPRKVMDSDLYDDVPDDDSVIAAGKSFGITGRLKSLFGFGKG